MKKTIKKCLSAILCALLLFAFPLTLSACKGGNPRIVITLTDGRKMTAELYPDIAPQTVERVLALVKEKAYDGVIFHRVIKDFMIQTGGFKVSQGKLMQLSADSLHGEFAANGFSNPLLHEKGVLSMARTNALNGASTQFFICTKTSPHLDGKYAAFGKLVDEKSLAVAMDISTVPTGAKYVFATDAPLEDIVIKTVRKK